MKIKIAFIRPKSKRTERLQKSMRLVAAIAFSIVRRMLYLSVKGNGRIHQCTRASNYTPRSIRREFSVNNKNKIK